MFIVGSVVKVDEEKCIGCMACDRVCPTEAIVTIDKLARVDEAACTGCMKCVEACMDHGAISRKILDEPVYLRADQKKVDRADIEALCTKARLRPQDIVCPCTGTKAGEVATAVLLGASKPADVSIGSGVRGVCSMWCTSAVIRMLEAAEIEIQPTPKNWFIYPDGLSPAIWNIPDEVAQKYPEYRLKESQHTLKTADLEQIGFPTILKDAN